MKNGCGEHSATQIAERNERAKKLYRYVTDVARRIDEATAACRNVTNLFTTSTEVQRQKLRDNCEKLIFLDPVNYGKKALELLWRKVYYETVSTAKKLHIAEEDYDNYLFTHMVCGIGQFHHLIARIQSDVKLQLKESDFIPLHKDEETNINDVQSNGELEEWGCSAIHSCLIYLGDLSRYQAEIFHTFDASIAARYYLQAAHIDLASGMPFNQLGNLYMEKNHNLDSACYYIHCLSCPSPFEGAMGNLTKLFDKNSQLLETINSTESNNLTQTEHIQRTITRFLSLIEMWYIGKEVSDIPQRCNGTAQDLRIALDLKQLPLPDIETKYDEYLQTLEDEIINPSFINITIMHEIVQICIFTIAKISETDEKKAFAAKAFSLAVLSQLLQNLLHQLQLCGFKNPASNYRKRYTSMQKTEALEEQKEGMTLEDIPVINGNDDNGITVDIKEKSNLENGDAKNISKKNTTKRRRRRRSSASESSELTDDTESSADETGGSHSEQDDNTDSSYQSDSKSEDSDNDCSDAELMTNKHALNGNANKKEIINNSRAKSSVITEHVEKTRKDNEDETVLNVTLIQHFLRGNNFLPSMKLLQDWVLKEKDLILSCGDSGESLFQCVVDLLNILEYNFKPKQSNKRPQGNCKIMKYAKNVAMNLELEYTRIPLPEDVNLRGTTVCKFDTNAAEWNILNQYKPSVYEENIVRILHFIDFGHQIAKLVPRIRYNRTMQIFFLKKIPIPKLNTKLNHKKGREWHNSKKPHVESEGGLLRRLGRLWLASRVRELELVGRAAAPTLLAVDARSLLLHLRRVRHLARAHSFIVLIPTVVLQELDDLKRDQIAARDAIRWLETQLQAGSRFLRAQRPGQSRPLPLLKYPRKAPPHVHNFIQILEFCYHFIADEKPGGDGDADTGGKNAPMLLLLTGDEPGTSEEPFKDFSKRGAAKAAGVTLEHITHFYSKWRQTIHKGGKKR